MVKRLLFILFTAPLQLTGQVPHDGLEFSRIEFNLSKVESWVSSIDSIEITNITNKKIHLLKQNDPRGFELRFPARSIDPGKTEVIEIIFMPKEKGKFNISFPIYHSASLTPVIITYKGEILSFDEFADAACPSFSKPNLKPVEFELEITVLDSSTKKPLPGSFIEITRGEYFSQHTADAGGMYKRTSGISYYAVLAEHPGYKSRSSAKHVNPKNRKIVIELPQDRPGDRPRLMESDSVLPLPVPDSGFSLAGYKRNNIIFLIDKSSSMNQPDCMPLLQAAMIRLAKMARPEDRITIITYSNEAKVVLPGTSGSEREKIITVVQQLKCGGRTEGGKAIYTAYKNAEENFIEGGVNQIIVATDGGFNGISENEAELMQLVETKMNAGIRLSVLAFGQNRYGKAHIARLAKQGEGFYVFIATPEDAEMKLTDTIRLQSKLKQE